MNLTLHGANPENLYKIFNIKMPEKILDFSTNTNIFSWPEFDINVKELASNYPDPECLKLRELISERENINLNRILFTNGINEAIFILANLFRENTAIFQPCYSEYSRAFVKAENIFGFNDLKGFHQIIITNPNNPTGSYISNLSEIIENYPDKIFIIDEAYIDFLIHNEKRERLCEFENVVLLRSLTKIFHLSGIRIGYVIANEKIISAMKNLQPSWSVNSIAQELALKFLNDENFYNGSRNFYRKNTPIFIENLRSSGFEVMNSSVHYFLVKVDNDIEIIKFLLNNGIVARHTRNFAGLEGKYIRVATRFSDENKIFVEVMKKL